jgi:hypothetical protein
MDSCFVFLPISEPGCCAYHEVCRSHNELVLLAALRIPLMNPPYVGILKLYTIKAAGILQLLLYVCQHMEDAAVHTVP